MTKPATTDSEAKAIKVRALAAEWDCSSRTIWRLIAADELKCVRIGRSVRVTRASIDAFVAKGGVR